MEMRNVSRQYKSTSICQLSGKISNQWLFVQIFNREYYCVFLKKHYIWAEPETMEEREKIIPLL
jgi:hypothetical protein